MQVGVETSLATSCLCGSDVSKVSSLSAVGTGDDLETFEDGDPETCTFCKFSSGIAILLTLCLFTCNSS